MTMVFQFLIGRLSTDWNKKVMVERYEVSIPYRQTINLIFDTKIDSKGLFQFLIGRLSTLQIRDSYCNCSKFQFLIGRLSTQKAINKQFQWRYVSIPYRQTINQHQRAAAVCSPGLMFQFLIGRLSTGHDYTPPLFIREFQFLIGRLSTKCTLPLPRLLRCFNSLQVDYQQVSALIKGYLIVMFQFLIGRLSTFSSGTSLFVSSSFNSLQVDYQLYSKCTIRKIGPRFQFLIGRLSTIQHRSICG